MNLKIIIMKKAMFSLAGLLVYVVSSFSQVAVEPIETLSMNKGNIPPAVIQTANQFFKGETQINWGIFPNQPIDLGWDADQSYNEPLDHYEIHMQGRNGSEIDAIVESTGKVIAYRASIKNASLPQSVKDAISKTQFRDWDFIKDSELIKENQTKVVDQFSVKLEKGREKKTLYYTITGDQLVNKN